MAIRGGTAKSMQTLPAKPSLRHKLNPTEAQTTFRSKTPRIWVWRILLRHVQLSTAMLHHYWEKDREALKLWKSDPMTLVEALYALRNDSIIACTNGMWWLRDPREPELT